MNVEGRIDSFERCRVYLRTRMALGLAPPTISSLKDALHVGFNKSASILNEPEFQGWIVGDHKCVCGYTTKNGPTFLIHASDCEKWTQHWKVESQEAEYRKMHDKEWEEKHGVQVRASSFLPALSSLKEAKQTHQQQSTNNANAASEAFQILENVTRASVESCDAIRPDVVPHQPRTVEGLKKRRKDRQNLSRRELLYAAANEAARYNATLMAQRQRRAPLVYDAVTRTVQALDARIVRVPSDVAHAHAATQSLLTQCQKANEQLQVTARREAHDDVCRTLLRNDITEKTVETNQPITKPQSAHSAFHYFCNRRRDGVAQSLNSDAASSPVDNELTRLWRAMSPNERLPYETLSQQDKDRFESEMKQFESQQQQSNTKDRSLRLATSSRDLDFRIGIRAPTELAVPPTFVEDDNDYIDDTALSHSDTSRDEEDFSADDADDRSSHRKKRRISSSPSVVSSAEARARRARRQLQPHEQTCSVCNGHRVPELPTDAAVINDTSRFHVQSGEHAPRFFERQARRKTVAERVFFTCEECFKCFHAFCAQYDADMALAARRVVLSGGNWYCTDCKACTVCASPTAPAQLIICDGCDRGYHTFCLNPALSRVPSGSWKCNDCRLCWGCGATQSRKWHQHGTVCDHCAVAHNEKRACPVCKQTHRVQDAGDKPMIQCDRCAQWVHQVCTELSEQEWTRLHSNDDATFYCAVCSGSVASDHNNDGDDNSNGTDDDDD